MQPSIPHSINVTNDDMFYLSGQRLHTLTTLNIQVGVYHDICEYFDARNISPGSVPVIYLQELCYPRPSIGILGFAVYG